ATRSNAPSHGIAIPLRAHADRRAQRNALSSRSRLERRTSRGIGVDARLGAARIGYDGAAVIAGDEELALTSGGGADTAEYRGTVGLIDRAARTVADIEMRAIPLDAAGARNRATRQDDLFDAGRSGRQFVQPEGEVRRLRFAVNEKIARAVITGVFEIEEAEIPIRRVGELAVTKNGEPRSGSSHRQVAVLGVYGATVADAGITARIARLHLIDRLGPAVVELPCDYVTRVEDPHVTAAIGADAVHRAESAQRTGAGKLRVRI